MGERRRRRRDEPEDDDEDDEEGGEDTMTLTVDTANDNVVKTQYAVRGEIVQIAAQLASEGKKIIYCNIGNPQSLGQKPITFFRQVLALCDCPTLLESPDVEKLFPTDAIARARAVLSACPGGTGAYSQSKGIQKEGTFHFRTTFLPSEEDFPTIVKGLTEFHEEFMKKYS